MEEHVVEKKGNGSAAVLDKIFYGIGIVFILYQLVYVKTIPYVPALHTLVHLGFAMLLLCFSKVRSTESSTVKKVYAGILSVLAVVVTVLFFRGYQSLVQNPSYPPTWALVCGAIAAIIAMIVVRWSYGWLFPIFAAISFFYVIFGNYFPGPLKTGSTSVVRALTLLAADVTSPWGVYGNLLTMSANYLFLFIIFGSALSTFGSMRFIVELGNIVASKLRSGPAALSVITSALMGSITGSTVANITVTGAFTIPMMKKAGFKPEVAAAMEAGASNGGQFLPPVMGATVFVMASYTGLPYLSIAKAAVISALIYYAMLLLYAELSARKSHLEKTEFVINKTGLILDAPLFIVPLGLLIFLLFKGYSLMTVVFWTVISVVVLGLLSTLRKDVTLDAKKMVKEMVDGAMQGANVAALLAVIGVCVAAMEVTGLTLKLSIFLNALAGSNLLLLLLFTMVCALLLGCAVPTPAAYVITATVLSPSLVRMGVPLLTAHLFPLFYAFLSHITPPVGIGLLVACKLAGAEYLKGAKEVWKAAFPSLIFPYIFVYSPAILLNFKTPLELIATIVGTCVMLFSMLVIFNRQWKYRLNALEYIMLAAAAVLSAIYLFAVHNPLFVIASLAICVVTIIGNMRREGVEIADA